MHDMETLKGKKLLRRDEACEYLGVSMGTLNKVIHDKHFPALVRIGMGRGRVFINREKLDEWIDARTGKTW